MSTGNLITEEQPAIESARRRRQAAILRAAELSFREYGFTNARVEDIAKAAGVTRKTLFNNFESKENLLIETLASICSEERTRFPEPEEPMYFDVRDALPADMPARLELIGRLRWILSMAARYAGAYDAGGVDTLMFGSPIQRSARIKRIEVVQRSGGIRSDIDATSIEMMFELLRDSIYRRWLLGNDASFEALRDRFNLAMTIFLDGLKPDRSSE